MEKQVLTDDQKSKLSALSAALVNQEAARILVPPNENRTGFWFGGGGLAADDDGTLWLYGRYRNFGDSRTGLAAGERGLECTLFASRDGGRTFTRERSWSKADLSFPGNKVLSIEGTSLHRKSDGTWELFISSEKERPYPDCVGSYLKPGCGVWSVDVIEGATPGELDAATIRPVLAEFENPSYIHIKDPVVYDGPGGATHMVFCSHPFCWTCANSGLAVRRNGVFEIETREVATRGPTWDVAGCRITSRLQVPQIGVFSDCEPVAMYFYDGLECVRQHDENTRAISRPRGYSCEEIGGLLVGFDSEYPSTERLSALFPFFISPMGTGCSRYVETAATSEGLWAVWQQSQEDLSQPFVGHFLPNAEVERILA